MSIVNNPFAVLCVMQKTSRFVHCKFFTVNVEYYIARKITKSGENRKQISGPIVKIATFGIALGLAVMIIAVAIVTGFKNEVSSKITGFGAHIQITNFDSNNSFETVPINKNQVSTTFLNAIKGVKHSQVYITKSGIIKTHDNIQAIILKGVDENYDWSFLQQHLVAGDIFKISDSVKSKNILISEQVANLLNLKVGDKITTYFVQDPPRMRPFVISGIYKTSIEDFDKTFAIVDLKHLQKLYGWTENQVTGYEVMIDDFNKLEQLKDSVFEVAGYQFTPDGAKLKIATIKQKYPQIFDWLNIQDVNVWIILILMLVVAGFNMVSGLLILILERTNMIGLLKGLGYDNWRIRKIFLYQSGFLIVKGLFWGNIIGITLCLVQKHFGIIPLDETTYYMNKVPINLQLSYLVLLNIGTLLATVFMMLLPSFLITKISPAKAIKFN